MSDAFVTQNPAKPDTPPRIRSTAEFARYVGLARTTVSRVLNGQPGLKKKTIDKVQRAIAETGFVPNAYALHLKGKRSATIGVCLQNLTAPPLVRKLSLLQEKLRERQFQTFIEVADAAGSADVIRHFLSLRVEAVVFIGFFDAALLEENLRTVEASGTPAIVIDQDGIKDSNTVFLDRARGMSDLVEHLIGLGHRSFGLLGYTDDVRSTHERVRGIREALKKHGLRYEEATRLIDAEPPKTSDFEYGRALARAFHESGRMPSALLAQNDEIGIGALLGLKERGVRVPEDVSVTGFNNQEIGLMTSPTLTSVDQRIAATVDAAFELLFSRLDNPAVGKPVSRSIKPALVLRESTGPARRK